MANKIARGTTGTATFLNEMPYPVGSVPPGWTWVITGSGTYATTVNPQGWNIDAAGNVTAPANAPVVNDYIAYVWIDKTPPPPPYYYRQLRYSFEVVCMLEVVTVGTPTWNATTNKWDYPVTITGQGGTSPYSSTPSSPTTVSLSPGTSTSLASSTSDSGSCSANSSTPIGPAPIPPGGPSQGPGPSGPQGADGSDSDDSGDEGDGDHSICQTCLCPIQADGSRPDCKGDLTQPTTQGYSQYGRTQHGDSPANTGNVSPSMGVVIPF